MPKNETETGPEIFRCGVPITVAKMLRMVEGESPDATIDIIPGRSPSLVVHGPAERQPELTPAEGRAGAVNTGDATT